MKSLRMRMAVYGIAILLGVLAALPNALPDSLSAQLPAWYADRHVALGLDLKGGAHLLLEVDTEHLATEKTLKFVQSLAEELTEAGLRVERAAATPAGAALRVTDSQRLARAVELARAFAREEGERQYVFEVEGERLLFEPTLAARRAMNADAVERSLEVVRRRLDETGVVEPSITRQGEDGILVQLPGVEDPGRIRELLGTTARLSFHLVENDGASQHPTMRLPGSLDESYLVQQQALLTGEQLRSASTAFSQTGHEPVVNFRLDKEGGAAFAEITRNNIGRPFAIVLDGRVVSAPVIQGVIPNGSGQISGRFSVAEASDLALLLRAGALPAPLRVIEERTVGAELGAEAIEMGLYTGLLGAALVFAFMLALYGPWGLIANLALGLNVILTLGALSLLGGTLTLPGIAGIILSIGMAVDANILINERIREELRRGLKPLAALEAGFKRAYGTILDSNVTTLIATSLLFMLGSGPIQGFAVTMALGLMMSMFTAVAVVRLLMEWRIRKAPRGRFKLGGLIQLDRLAAGGPLRFMRARFLGLAISAMISLASIGLLAYQGLNLGVDFAGGTLVEVQAEPPPGVERLRQDLAGAGLEVSIQEFGGGGLLVRAPLKSADDAATAAVVGQIRQSVKELSPQASFPRVEIVGPKVSADFADSSGLALLWAALGMLAYLWLRFEWHFGLAAVVTMALDLTKMFGLFALLGLEFNLAAVAALLTLIGYSVNDNVVVFDRIRERLREGKPMPLRQLFDESITATLPRTIFTSVTTMLALLPMGVAGGAAVASFALPMLFGIVLGTSSSIFVAAPIVLLVGERMARLGRSQLGEGDERERQLMTQP